MYAKPIVDNITVEAVYMTKYSGLLCTQQHKNRPSEKKRKKKNTLEAGYRSFLLGTQYSFRVYKRPKHNKNFEFHIKTVIKHWASSSS